MSEQLLQYIWKQRLFEQRTYIANTGDEVQVVYTGEQNTNAGPDFQFVKVRISGTLWVGNCEVHLNASDWYKHHHDGNGAYDNIVLHVVKKLDADITNSLGRKIPTIELQYNQKFEDNYHKLLNSGSWLACGNAPRNVERFHQANWLTALSVERLEKRAEDIVSHLTKNIQNTEEVFYQFLAKAFGFKVNAVAFEMLAKALPLLLLAKHKNNLFQLEALLFGQSGLLSLAAPDDYTNALAREYAFLQKKYSLSPVDANLWKFLRLRPVNFPTVRIAQFAALVHKSSGLYSKIMETEHIEALYQLFSVSPSLYWDTHYNFGSESPELHKPLSKASVQLLLVNSVVPFMFVYGKMKRSEIYCERAVNILESISPEKNSIIEQWKMLGIEPRNMLESQALLQLKNEYCSKQKCLQCEFGNRYMNE